VRHPARAICALALALAAAPAWCAVNSYRFLHVTIDTPWHIFLFLLMGIFAPFILMVVLMWRNSIRRNSRAEGNPEKRADADKANPS
jgi:hypothetical protein